VARREKESVKCKFLCMNVSHHNPSLGYSLDTQMAASCMCTVVLRLIRLYKINLEEEIEGKIKFRFYVKEISWSATVEWSRLSFVTHIEMNGVKLLKEVEGFSVRLRRGSLSWEVLRNFILFATYTRSKTYTSLKL
jgi:hypothetical protein